MKSSNSANPLLSARINRLRDAVQAAHHCMAAHVQSVPVIEKPGDRALWQGVVEVFTLMGHPKAKRCYAWFSADKDDGQTTMVLEIPPVDSPRAAVKTVLEGGTPPAPSSAAPPASPAT